MWTDEFTASINIELAYDTLVFDDHKEEINGENKNYGKYNRVWIWSLKLVWATTKNATCLVEKHSKYKSNGRILDISGVKDLFFLDQGGQKLGWKLGQASPRNFQDF